MDSTQLFRLVDTVRVHDTLHVAAQQSNIDLALTIGKWVVSVLGTILALLGGVRYFGHRRFKANESAIVKTTEASADADAAVTKAGAEADVSVTRAEAKAQVAVIDSMIEKLQFWEKQAKNLDESLNNARAELSVIQAQFAEATKKESVAQALLDIERGKVEALKDEIVRLKERIELDKEQIAEVPILRNQVQTLYAKCEALREELKKTVELIQT